MILHVLGSKWCPDLINKNTYLRTEDNGYYRVPVVELELWRARKPAGSMIDPQRNAERQQYEHNSETPKAHAVMEAVKELLEIHGRPLRHKQVARVMKSRGWGNGRCTSALNGLAISGRLVRLETEPPTYLLPSF